VRQAAAATAAASWRITKFSLTPPACWRDR
jgi:hypothetical protein